MRKVLLIGNHEVVIYNFRLELIEELLKRGYEVFLALPYGKRVDELKQMGCKFIETPLERHGTNFWMDLKLFIRYLKILKNVEPEVVLTYTIKPNIYGALASRMRKVSCIATITGLGNTIEKSRCMQFFITTLYRIAFSKVKAVFFQNEENQKFFFKQKIKISTQKLVSGSGVNIEHFSYLAYPESSLIKFAFIGRVMKEKGIEEFLKTADYICSKFADVEFHIYGFLEDDYREILDGEEKGKNVIYHGMVEDIRQALKEIHCVVLPSYHEGMSNALLEAAACGRPLIASNISGCKEILTEGVNGFLVKAKNAEDLINKVERFLKLDIEEKRRFGLNSRKKAEKEFDRKIIVGEYIDEIILQNNESSTNK